MRRKREELQGRQRRKKGRRWWHHYVERCSRGRARKGESVVKGYERKKQKRKTKGGWIHFVTPRIEKQKKNGKKGIKDAAFA